MTRIDAQTPMEARGPGPANGASSPRAARVLVISQNAHVPRDRRVWNELRALSEGGYEVTAICPKAEDADGNLRFERLAGVDIFRFAQPRASGSALSYLREYAVAFWRIRRLARTLAGERGFDVVQASNPPDFLLMAVYFLKRRGARLIFDHHDLAPELYLARFGGDHRVLYWLTRLLEQINYRLADLVLATNESYKRVALRRGRRRPEDVFVVRSGPQHRGCKQQIAIVLNVHRQPSILLIRKRGAHCCWRVVPDAPSALSSHELIVLIEVPQPQRPVTGVPNVGGKRPIFIFYLRPNFHGHARGADGGRVPGIGCRRARIRHDFLV